MSSIHFETSSRLNGIVLFSDVRVSMLGLLNYDMNMTIKEVEGCIAKRGGGLIGHVTCQFARARADGGSDHPI